MLDIKKIEWTNSIFLVKMKKLPLTCSIC